MHKKNIRQVLQLLSLSSILILLNYRGLQAQDSLKILSLGDLYTQITTHHPIVQQAEAMDELALQELRMARGYFDPKLALDYDRKQFEEKTYFNVWNSYLKIPLWIGELKAGYEQSHGTFLNPEYTTPTEGLISVGITIPLGQGLWIDARRATLRKARYFQEIAKAEKIKIINKVLYQAAKDYWQWYFAYQQHKLYQESWTLAKRRYEAVKRRIEVEELAVIDSVKAKNILQERKLQWIQAALELKNARLIVSNYLWDAQSQPLEIQENVIPQAFLVQDTDQPDFDLANLLTYAESNHPEIKKMLGKLRQLAVERTYQAEQFKPKANLSYNFLQQARNATKKSEFSYTPFQENYKLGVQFLFPLLLRKERGKVQKIRVKEKQLTWQLEQFTREITNNVSIAYNELTSLWEQIKIQQDVAVNYRILRNGELRKFSVGESELFLVNTRDNQLIDAQIKVEKQKVNYQKARARLVWETGLTAPVE